MVCHRVGCLGPVLTVTCPVFPSGIASFRSHLVTQLEQGEEPWMPDQVDVTPASEREAQKGPGPGKWIPAKGMMSGLGPKPAILTDHASVWFQGWWPHNVYLSFPILDIETYFQSEF